MNCRLHYRIANQLDERLASLTKSLQHQITVDGSLHDPLQGQPAPTDHYAQIATALAQHIRDPGTPLSRQLLESWLALSPKQRGHAPFNRFLLLLLSETLHTNTNQTSSIEPALIDECLSQCPLAKRYPSNNWILLAQLCRLMEAASKKQRAQATRELERMLDRWTTPAGGFVDFPGHDAGPGRATPMAYHHKALFVTTMALRYTHSPKLMGHLQRMQDWVLLSWDGQNHVGGFGRSTHSLFGDACLLASLLLAGFGASEKAESSGAKMINGILNRWSGQCRDDGLLELNPAGQQHGWDNYMFLSVYNGWAAAIAGFARHVTMDDSPVLAQESGLKGMPEPVLQDADAGLLRIKTEAGLTVLLSTRGQLPQAFSRDEVEFRYAGGMPFHILYQGQVICPPATRTTASKLREQPALAGWTPVFEIDGSLFGLTGYREVEVEQTSAAYRITLKGSPLPLLRPAASTPWQKLKAAIDWRYLGGAWGRRAVLYRRPAKGVKAKLVITLSRNNPELIHELTLETASIDSVRYINPVGHALVETALPRTRELETGTQGKTEVINTTFEKAALDAAIPGATGHCLAAQSVGPSGYCHRLRLEW